MFRPSDRFESAAAYLSASPALSKVSNDVKLELYALYKCITVSKSPQTPRPSLFDFTGRAKWDAWYKLGMHSDESQPDKWTQRYLEIAQSLGWQEGVQSDPVETGDASANVFDDGSEERGSGGGMGIRVSAISQPPPDAGDHGTLHGFALTDDAKGLLTFLKTHADINLDSLDEYGYTALHLAADRGNKSVVQLLLERGADVSIKDSDELTAIELAEVGEHGDIANMIRGHTTT